MQRLTIDLKICFYLWSARGQCCHEAHMFSEDVVNRLAEINRGSAYGGGNVILKLNYATCIWLCNGSNINKITKSKAVEVQPKPCTVTTCMRE